MRKLLILIILLLTTTHAHALTPAEEAEAGRALDNLQQKEESVTREWIRKRAQEMREREQPSVTVPVPEFKELAGGACFDVKSIELQAATILSDKDKAELTDTYVGNCMDLAAVNKLVRDITN